MFSGNIIHQPAYQNVKYKIFEKLANSDIVMNNTFFIGVYPGINDEKINYISEKLKKFFTFLWS
jgi:CDP-6-deoxy-D-xylo-4-hexulose-3-dehydrase